jgi:bacterial/archaeal transporter family protein
VDYAEGMTSWVFWALLSAVFAAATALLAKVGIEGVDSNLATAIRTSVILIFTWAIAIALEKHHGLALIGRRSWMFLVLSGIATGLSWLCYFRALQLGPASSVAPVDKLSVVLVIVFAAVFLGERLTPLKMVGGSLIAAGAVILAFA